MFRSVLDVPGNGREVGQLVNNFVDNVNHTLIGVVLVCGENEGRGTGLGCGGLLVPYIYGREEGVWCVCVRTCGCECHGKNAVTWWFVYVPVFIVYRGPSSYVFFELYN